MGEFISLIALVVGMAFGIWTVHSTVVDPESVSTYQTMQDCVTKEKSNCKISRIIVYTKK